MPIAPDREFCSLQYSHHRTRPQRSVSAPFVHVRPIGDGFHPSDCDRDCDATALRLGRSFHPELRSRSCLVSGVINTLPMPVAGDCFVEQSPLSGLDCAGDGAVAARQLGANLVVHVCRPYNSLLTSKTVESFTQFSFL